jgi:hypothetical protein
MTAAFRSDYNPQTELESQLVQHIVDGNMRLHRIAAIESNMFAAGTIDSIREDVKHDAATEAVIAQTRVWIKQADFFEKLSRHEGRISRQLLKYTQEIDRVQAVRKTQVVLDVAESKPDNTKLALLCKQSPPDLPPHPRTAVAVAPIVGKAPAAMIEVDSPPEKQAA